MNYYVSKIETPKKTEDKRLRPGSPQKLAAEAGLIHFQGKPCSRGHSGLRYTKGSRCIECIGELRGKAVNPRGRSSANHEKSLDAAVSGNTTYVPENACKRGHRLRFVNSNNCVECDELAREKHKLSSKFHRIRREYGLHKNEYLNLVWRQNSSCKLCDKFEADHFKLHVDHCHKTNVVRGLLCGKCNQGIGLLNHDPDLIRRASVYCE